jgi:hypothetical protein
MNPFTQSVSSKSKLECDAVPCDDVDAVRCDLSDSVPHHGNFAMTTKPTMESENDAVRVKPDGCQSDATRYRTPFHFTGFRGGCPPPKNNMLLPPYGCHAKLSTVLQISPYPYRNQPVQDEYSFPVRLPEYSDYESRIQSFRGKWPKYLGGPTPEDLARAGFFYLGEGDKVKCFSCGVSLHEWEQKDSAYLEHARWSPECHYLPLVGARP